MSCSCTGNCDLININELSLSDTFHTWYDRTNEIIRSVNAVNIFDIDVGVTDSGLTANTTCIGGDYNGVVRVRVNAGPGIGIGPSYYHANKVLVDMSGLSAFADGSIAGGGGQTSFPSVDDYYLISDVSDTSLNTGSGTPKKIKARQILPPTVYLPDNFEFKGDVQIDGDLIVSGTRSFIDSNEVLIEDKAIELAYRRFVQVDVTGHTAPNNIWPAPGMTFSYFDLGEGSTATPSTIGQISSVSFRGDITTLTLHRFVIGGVADIDPLGRISISGSNFDFTMVAGPTTSTSFFNDDELDEAGIIVKGSTSDKAFLWTYKEGPSQVLYDAFISNKNLGVSGSSNAVIASKFRSYGYADSSANNTFQFMGYDTSGKPKLILGGGTGSNISVQYGHWSVQHENYGGTSQQQPLVWRFKDYVASSEVEKFTLWSGASGHTFPATNITGQGSNQVGNFAHKLNVDFLDGAHGTTYPTAFSIPIALTGGKIADGWINSSVFNSITKCYTQASHGFAIGDVVRMDPNTGGITYAQASSREYAEALGIVSTVDGSNFCVVSKGYISGLAGGASTNIYDVLPLVTGNVYFLSPDTPGGLIEDPNSLVTPLGIDEVRKPMLLALGPDNGYVVNYLGVIEGDETDIVDVQGLAPLGTITAFSGTLDNIPYGWLLCDGSRLEKGMWSDLYSVVGNTNYNEATTQTVSVSGNITLFMKNADNYGLVANDLITVKTIVNTVEYSANTKVVSVTGNQIVVSRFTITVGSDSISLSNREFKVYGRVGTGGTSIFFLPDYRTRSLIGATRDTGATFGGLDLALADSGGATSSFIGLNQIPSHSHQIKTGTVQSGSGATVLIGNSTATENSPAGQFRYTDPSSAPSLPFSVMQPYRAVHWIIRAKRGSSALILTGHNHDGRYHFFQAPMQISAGPAGYYGDWGVYHTIPTEYPRLKRNGGFTGIFINRWDMGLINNPSGSINSVLQTFCYGDFTLFSDGITLDNLTGGGYAGKAFEFDSKVSQAIIYGANNNNRFAPSIILKNDTNNDAPLGYISGLTSPQSYEDFLDTSRNQDMYAVNKFYTDTAPKVIYTPLPSGKNAASDRFPVGAFNIITANGVFDEPKTIMSVLADKEPGSAAAKTEVHIRGDLNVWGNNLTGQVGSQTLTAHNYIAFSVDTLMSRVRILGGYTYPGLATTPTFPPTLSFWNRDPIRVGPESAPIGIIEGLTAPVRTHEAANKWYVDQRIASIQFPPQIIPIATTSTTGVAFFYDRDFAVNSEGRVSLVPRGIDIYIDKTGELLGLGSPQLYGVTGFNIKTLPNPNLFPNLPQRTVFSIFANDDARLETSDDSSHEVNVAGDFTVWGDAWGRNANKPAYKQEAFSVNPITSNVTIYGGLTGNYVNGSLLTTPSNVVPQAPNLSFVDRRGDCRGVIDGLTAPVSDCQAANKWYVDQKASSFADEPYTVEVVFGYGMSGMDEPKDPHPNKKGFGSVHGLTGEGVTGIYQHMCRTFGSGNQATTNQSGQPRVPIQLGISTPIYVPCPDEWETMFIYATGRNKQNPFRNTLSLPSNYDAFKIDFKTLPEGGRGFAPGPVAETPWGSDNADQPNAKPNNPVLREYWLDPDSWIKSSQGNQANRMIQEYYGRPRMHLSNGEGTDANAAKTVSCGMYEQKSFGQFGLLHDGVPYAVCNGVNYPSLANGFATACIRTPPNCSCVATVGYVGNYYRPLLFVIKKENFPAYQEWNISTPDNFNSQLNMFSLNANTNISINFLIDQIISAGASPSYLRTSYSSFNSADEAMIAKNVLTVRYDPTENRLALNKVGWAIGTNTYGSKAVEAGMPRSAFPNTTAGTTSFLNQSQTSSYIFANYGEQIFYIEFYKNRFNPNDPEINKYYPRTLSDAFAQKPIRQGKGRIDLRLGG